MKISGLRGIHGRRAQEANEEIQWLIGESVLVIVFTLAIFYWLASLQNNTLLEKNYLSRDLALLVDSMYSSPGNVEYTYNTNVVNISKFNFFFKDQKVSTVEIGNEEAVQYWYADDKVSSSMVDGESRAPQSIKLCETNGVVTVGRSTCSDMARIRCPAVDTTLGRTPKIFLNPVFGGREKGLTDDNANFAESEAVRKIALSLKNLDSASHHFEFYSTRDLSFDLLPPDDFVSVEQRANMMKTRDYDAWINLEIGNSSDGGNPVVAYAPSYPSAQSARDKKNEKLGCVIENTLIENNPEITSVSPVIRQDSNPLLSPDNNAVAVTIELGSIQFPYSSAVSSPDQTASAIYAALLDYYGIKSGPGP